MFVNHLNGLLEGGAATAARRLHLALLRAGTDSIFYHRGRRNPSQRFDATFQPARWRAVPLQRRLQSTIGFRMHRESFKRLVRGRPDGLEILTSPRGAPHTPWPPAGHPSREDSASQEIIHLHWIARFIDYDSFFGSLDAEQPVVWTLHDMNAFTGGCHFSNGCDRYKSGCGNCPQLCEPSDGDLTRQFFLQKQCALAGLNLHITAPSRWLLSSARTSPMFGTAKSFHHIPYGISTTQYYPMDRREARARLGIDPDVTVVCFGAMDIKNRRKGTDHLLRALEAIADLPNVEGLVFGAGQLPRTSTRLPRLHEVGSVEGLLQQRAVYSASNIFVLPSLEDNLPLTGLEALACGVPIVGFDAGGIPDYVHPNQTGLLAPTGDAEDLGRKLRSLAMQPHRVEAMSRAARTMIEQQYSDQREATAYQRLYESILESARPSRQAAA